MRPSISLFIALRYVLVRQGNRSVSFISAIAMTGIVLGVALLITVLSVMNGFDQELKERILNVMPQVTLYHQHTADWPTVRTQLLANQHIEGVTPFVELQAMLHHKRFTQPVLVYGVSVQHESSVSDIQRYLQRDTLSRLSTLNDAIVIGEGIASALNVEVNDQVTLIVPRALDRRKVHSSQTPSIRRLVVIDILKTQTELDHSLALMGIDQAAELQVATGKISGLRIKVSELLRAPQVARQIQTVLPVGFYTTDWTHTHGNLYYAIKMSKNLVGLLLLLIIAIAAFNIVSTLIMVVVDKQRDIAILKTLGLSTRKTMSVFIIQGSIIGAIGTAIGAVLGVLLALYIPAIIGFLEIILSTRFLSADIYPVSFLPSAIMWQDVAAVTAMSLLMSTLATLYPAWKAASVMPAQALRYD